MIIDNKINIALIDSGVSNDFIDIDANIEFINLGLFTNNSDFNKHGSYIAYILSKTIPNINIFSIKIFDSEYMTKEEDIIRAFQWVLKNDFIDVVHFSGGCNAVSDYYKLNNTINEIVEKGIVIVSAFENNGQCTWPAACDNVIGVKRHKYIHDVNKYIFVRNSQINILGFGGIVNIPEKNKSRTKLSGSSFSSPYITSKIVSIVRENNIDKDKNRLKKILEFLARDANKIIDLKTTNDNYLELIKNRVRKINRAITYPFSKEIHAIVGNKDLLSFEISNVYDSKYFGNIGKKVNDCCYCYTENHLHIESIENLDWNSDFDTLILGHLDTLMSIDNNKYDIHYFIRQAYVYRKNIYLFDQIEIPKEVRDKFNDIGCSIIDFNTFYNDNNFGCMKLLSIPVLAVVGTSPKQGKFNLQLHIRRKFLEDGYRIEQLGSEPNSLLFGMDIMYSNGYGAKINLDFKNEIMYLNEQAWANSIDKEILIVGTQSQTIPYGYGNIDFYNFGQLSILCATNPDSFILCVNPSDDINYITRTINYLESVHEGDVICIVIFPFEKNYNYNIEGDISSRLDDTDLRRISDILVKKLGIPCLINGEKSDMDRLYEIILDNF